MGCKRKLYAAGACVAVFGFQVPAETLLREMFEASGGVTNGALGGQGGWKVFGDSADVQSSQSFEGSGALHMSQSMVWKDAAPHGNRVWVRFFARLDAPPVVLPQAPDGVASVSFFIGTDREVCAFSGGAPVGLGAYIPLQTWTRFDVFCDYGAMVWNLSMDGTTIGAALPMVSTNRQVESVRISSESLASLFVDAIEVLDHELAADAPDLDKDQIPDWWEWWVSGSITGIDPEAPSANGGVSYRAAYLAALSPFEEDLFVSQLVAPNHLRWDARPARVYEVDWAPSLSSNFTTVASLAWPLSEYVDERAEEHPAGFYRLKVRLP